MLFYFHVSPLQAICLVNCLVNFRLNTHKNYIMSSINNITVAIVLDKKRASKKGYPVKLRITSDRKADYISLKTYLSYYTQQFSK